VSSIHHPPHAKRRTGDGEGEEENCEKPDNHGQEVCPKAGNFKEPLSVALVVRQAHHEGFRAWLFLLAIAN
jgi:hypothetical protein